MVTTMQALLRKLLRPLLCLLAATALITAHAETTAESTATEAGKKKGAAVAQALIALDDPQLHFHGGHLPGHTDFLGTAENLPAYLEQKYAIKCLTRTWRPAEDFDQGYAIAFTETMLAHLDQKHGPGFLHKAEEEAAALQGRADALKELAQGTLALETMGLPPRSRGAYMDLLKQRHGILLRAVAGCLVTSTITGHARGFNEVMMAEIQKRFGPDALANAERDAESQTAAKN
jgi:hypothetical protein